MPRRHLTSLQPAAALRASLRDGYGRRKLARDALAGVTVGIVAIPLSMALAIASGVPPQHGLYTAIVAGFLIALSGGARFSVSGPTAAFVVILYPIAQQFGLAGLMLATVMAGFLLIAMALLRLGRYIEYIPEAVTLGFTSGIAIVIAILQVRDLLGLPISAMPEQTVDKVLLLARSLPQTAWPEAAVAGLTLAAMLLWPRLTRRVPPHLPALLAAAAGGAALAAGGWEVQTIASRFQFALADGTVGHGIPPVLPSLNWPWAFPGAGGEPLQLDWALMTQLLPSALAIAMLGAIEPLLCAVVVDGMTGTRHSANSELLGQGIGNVVAPFFGGITATAAIARSTANVRAGAVSPVAAMVHAAVILAGLLMLAPLLSTLPLAAMAALLLVVAWNMSEARKALHLIKTAPPGDIAVFATCLGLTVLLDMVIAIAVGIVLASLLFMKTIAEMTRIQDISDDRKHVPAPPPPGWQVFKISGPLFFAAADRVFTELQSRLPDASGVVLYLDGVPVLDAGGTAALQRFIDWCGGQRIPLYLADLQFQPLKTMRRANLQPGQQPFRIFPTLRASLAALPGQRPDNLLGH